MRPGAGARQVLLLCGALAGCASTGAQSTPPSPSPPPVIRSGSPAAPAHPAFPPPPPPAPPPLSDAAVLESLAPDIWQDLLELDPDASLDPGDPED